MPAENILSIVEKEMKEHLKLLPRPLPQILDEMEDNIQAATEAAKRAEEAARVAKAASDAASKASRESAKRAIEAREASDKGAENATRAAQDAAAKAEATAKTARLAAEEAARLAKEAARQAQETAIVQQRIESLEKRLKRLEEAIPEERVVILREISKEESEKEILELFSKGQTLYYSDIAEQLGLDLRLVVEICNELQNRAEIEIVDDTLQRR